MTELYSIQRLIYYGMDYGIFAYRWLVLYITQCDFYPMPSGQLQHHRGHPHFTKLFVGIFGTPIPIFLGLRDPSLRKIGILANTSASPYSVPGVFCRNASPYQKGFSGEIKAVVSGWVIIQRESGLKITATQRRAMGRSALKTSASVFAVQEVPRRSDRT